MMRTLLVRVLPIVGGVVLGGIFAMGVLYVVLRLNREPMKRKEKKSAFVANFEVKKQRKQEKKKPIRQRPRTAPQQRSLAPAPVPVVGVGLTGIDFGLPGVGAGALGDLTGSLLGGRKDLKDVIMTKEAVDVMPRPVERRKPQFPARLHRSGVMKGVVVVSLLIGTDGSVQNVQVLSTSHPLFERSVMEVVREWRFEPARYKGQAVPLSMRQTIRFSQT